MSVPINVLLYAWFSVSLSSPVKIVDKQKIIREKKVQFVTGERDILSKLKHPFVVQLHCTFQDEARLCILTEYKYSAY